MKYSSKIKVHDFAWGGKLHTVPFPAHGQVSIIGSFFGGARHAHAVTKHLSGDTLADIHTSMLLEGTSKRNKNDIKIFLDSIGASLSFTADKDRLIFVARVRAESAGKILALVEEVLTSPTFPAPELSVLKKRLTADFALEAQSTQTQANINLAQMLYSESHPNHQDSTDISQTTAQKITRADLVKFHESCIDKRTLRMAIAGDITEETAVTLVQKYFARLPQADIAVLPYEVATSVVAQQKAAPIQDKASINYLLGITTGITKDHPDYPALALGLQILGAPGFTGRLMSTVREKEGLTYGVYAFPAGFGTTDGYCVVSATFAPELFAKGRAAIMREINLLIEKGITPAELKQNAVMFEARSRINCATSSDFARTAHMLAAEGRKPSYLDEFPQRILKLTAREVHAVLKKYLVPANMSESAAGPVTDADLSA